MVSINKYTLKSIHPYNLDETLYSGQSFKWVSLDISNDISDNWHQGIIDNRRVRLAQSKNNIYLWTAKKYADQDISTVSSYLRLDDDIEKIYLAISKNTYITSAIKKYRGLHLLRQPPWETLVTFICSANNNIPRIRQLVSAMSTKFGQKVTDTFGTFHLFPSSTELYNAGEESLRELGLGFRAKYVYAAAELDVNNIINVEKLVNKNYHESLDKLTHIPGVGDKIANCVLLFSLNKLEAFPVDVWIKRVLREVYIDATLPIPDSQIRPWAQKEFGEYAGYLNQYLFHNRRLFKSTIK